jgi:hypothetical protein
MWEATIDPAHIPSCTKSRDNRQNERDAESSTLIRYLALTSGNNGLAGRY